MEGEDNSEGSLDKKQMKKLKTLRFFLNITLSGTPNYFSN